MPSSFVFTASLLWFVSFSYLQYGSFILQMKSSYASTKDDNDKEFQMAETDNASTIFMDNASGVESRTLSTFVHRTHFAHNVTSTVPASDTVHQYTQSNSSSLNAEQQVTGYTSESTPFITSPRSHVILEALSMDQCLSNAERRQYNALNLQLFVKREKASSNWRSKSRCDVELIVPKGMVVKVEVLNFSSSSEYIGKLYVMESQRLGVLIDISDSRTIAGEFSLSNRVTAKVIVNNRSPGLFFLHVNFTAFTAANELEIEYTHPMKGHVQTPRWDGRVSYPGNMNSRVIAEIPRFHHILLSFHSFNLGLHTGCSEDFLRVFLHRVRNDVVGLQPLIELCGENIPPDPSVHKAKAVLFQFISNDRKQYPGFRALFSFHNESFKPHQTAEGLWNCSVSYWQDFRHHFSCNLRSNCINSEDEVDCSYVTDTCGSGMISAGNRCYILHRIGVKRKLYREMNEICQDYDGYLASFNTEAEWQQVWNVLQQYKGLWERVIVGLQPAQSAWPTMYHDSFYWADGSVALYLRLYNIARGQICIFFVGYWTDSDLAGGDCNPPLTEKHILCEVDRTHDAPSPFGIQLQLPTTQPNINHVKCPAGHVIHNFLVCDSHSVRFIGKAGLFDHYQTPSSSHPPHFTCADGVTSVPYTLMCDHRHDCPDGDDEGFCVFHACLDDDHYECNNRQCISAEKLCDGQDHCRDGSVSDKCAFEFHKSAVSDPPPLIVDLNKLRKLTVTYTSPKILSDGTIVCPETHFQCLIKQYYCLPVYLRCNDVYDCPNYEDEMDCPNYTCVGFYRCRSSQVCVHPDHLCDSSYQCPLHDDELLCDLLCPLNCTCYGLAFTCTAPFAAGRVPQLRYLDAHGSHIMLSDLKNNAMLIHLSLAHCNLTTFSNLTFPNLLYLDLSHNLIQSFSGSHLHGISNLKVLLLSRNPLSSLHASFSGKLRTALLSIDLSRTHFLSFDAANLTMFDRLQVLNLSASGVNQISGKGFQLLSRLQVLDVRGCPLSVFPRGIMANLEELQSVFADNYKLCCPATLPAGFDLSKCYAPSDEVSSCDTLLRSDFFRMFLYVFAGMALIGNAGSFIYRMVTNKARMTQSFSIFVTHLCVSDFLMGVYLTVIGVADRRYQGAYLWEDVRWRNSFLCKAAGFLSLLSCESSAFIISLITVDRFLVLQFPFSRVHFRRKSAQAACLSAWLVGLLIALLPLLPITSHWHFYQQSSICIPLPVTRRYFEGLAYSFGVIIVLNSALFVLIAIGQASIYHAIRANSMTMIDSSKSSSRDLTIARRLITIAMSDFLCWFPIGFLGLLASQDIPIPGEVNVGMAIFVLPLNSALNPFLYTLNIVREKRRQAQLKRLHALLQNQIQTKRKEMSGSEQCAFRSRSKR